MADITNKRISIDLIKKITYLLNGRYQYLYQLYQKYKEETNVYDNPINKEVKNIVVASMPSIEIAVTVGDQTETFSDIDMLFDLLDNKSKEIEKVTINCFAIIYSNTTNEDHYKSPRSEEDVSLYLREDVASIRFNFSNATLEYSKLKEEIEQLLNNAPASYDLTISKRYWRKDLPSLARGLALGLFLSIGLYAFCKLSNIDIYINQFVLGNFYCITAFLISIVIGLIIPGKNHSLYSALKIKQKYAGYSTYKKASIYKDDVSGFKQYAEVSIGKNYNHEKIREEIEINYAKSKLQVAALAIAFLIFHIVTTII